jgi:hypothetical protein
MAWIWLLEVFKAEPKFVISGCISGCLKTWLGFGFWRRLRLNLNLYYQGAFLVALRTEGFFGLTSDHIELEVNAMRE